MAGILGVKIGEYKLIEKGKKLNDDLKARIKSLLKEEKKTAKIELPKGVVDMSKSMDRMIGISGPVLEMENKVNEPLNQAVALQSISGKVNPNFMTIDYLKDIPSKEYIGLNMFGGTAHNIPTSIKIATESNLKAYNGLQFVFGNQSNSLKSAIDMHECILIGLSKPSGSLSHITDSIAFQNITDHVKENKSGYDSYIDFSSTLAKTLSNSAISGATFNNFFSADSFVDKAKNPSILDVLSGSSFTLFYDTENFEEEKEIIKQIDDNPELKEQVDSFFNELNEIINDNTTENIDEEKVEGLYSKFVRWISETFNKDEIKAKKIAQRILMAFPLIALILTLTYARINAVNNKIQHQETQEELHETKEELEEVKSDLKDLSVKVENDSQNLLDLNQKILDRINNESSQNMVALKDVNLRNGRSSKSKVIGKVAVSQIILVLDKKVKWMQIIYVDKNDQKPKTGWVYIEYFE